MLFIPHFVQKNNSFKVYELPTILKTKFCGVKVENVQKGCVTFYLTFNKF